LYFLGTTVSIEKSLSQQQTHTTMFTEYIQAFYPLTKHHQPLFK